MLIASANTASAANPMFLPQQEQLEKSRAFWDSLNIQNYYYEYTKIENGNPQGTVYPWTVTVTHGKTARSVDGNNNQINWETAPTFDQLFTAIQNHINANSAKFIDVIYNEKRGFPENIHVIMSDNSVYHVLIDFFHEVVEVADTRGQKQQPAKLQELEKCIAIWRAHMIENYTYQYKVLDANPDGIVYPWKVDVTRTNVATGKDGNGNQINWVDPRPQTMEELFARIRTALDKNAPFVQVTYSKIYGYPEDISIAYNKNAAAGGSYKAEISAFAINK